MCAATRFGCVRSDQALLPLDDEHAVVLGREIGDRGHLVAGQRPGRRHRFAQAAPERRGDGRVDAIGREEHHRRERGVGLGLTPLCGVSQTRQQREPQQGRAANRLKSPSPRRVQGRSKVPV